MAKRDPSRFMGCRTVVRCGKRRARPGRKGDPCTGWRGVVECAGEVVYRTDVYVSKQKALTAAENLRGGSTVMLKRAVPTRQVCKRWKRISMRHWKTGTPFTKRQCAKWGWK